MDGRKDGNVGLYLPLRDLEHIANDVGGTTEIIEVFEITRR